MASKTKTNPAGTAAKATGKAFTVAKESSDLHQSLEKGIFAALETYSNVHRGSGHFSMVTTHLYEKAREIVLDYLDLNKTKYTVIFGNARRAAMLKRQLQEGSYEILSSKDFGLPLGVRAIALKKQALPKNMPYDSGGGTSRLVAVNWVIPSKIPDRFEAGTPAVINVIAFARAIKMMQQYGTDIFMDPAVEKQSAAQILHNEEWPEQSGQQLLDALRKTHIGNNIPAPTMSGNKPYINLDNGASTPTFGPVWQTFRESLWQTEDMHKELVQEVKTIIESFLSAPEEQYDVIFTCNTTEAINLVAESLGRANENSIEPVVLCSLLEHSSNDLPWRMQKNLSVARLGVDKQGFFDMKELENTLQEYNKFELHGNQRIRLVALSGASNVMGSFNDLQEISRIAHLYGARLLVDGAQMLAHRKVEVEKLNIDYFACCAHKAYAPFGTGLLVVKKGTLQFDTGEMEKIKASGEENAPGIAAFGKSLLLLQRIGMDLIQKEEQEMTAYALRMMQKIGKLKISGLKNPDAEKFKRKGGVILFEIKGGVPSRLSGELARRGAIGTRFGCHCAHIMIKHLVGITPFLERFQALMITLFPKLQLPGLARLSLGLENTKADIDGFLEVLNSIVNKDKATNDQSVQLSKQEVKKKMQDFVIEREKMVYFF